MKLIRNLVAVLLCVVMLCGIAAAESASYTAGVYQAEAQGNNGLVKLAVTFSENAILNIAVLESKETEGLGDKAIETVAQAIVEHQSLAVDAVSGATNSSKAVLAAVAACVEQAGGNV